MTLCCWVDDTATLNRQRLAIEAFLRERLGLALHPNKTVLQRCTQGIDFLGSIVYPDHRQIRQRTVRALRRRLAWFNWLLYPATARPVPQPPFGTWHRWLATFAELMSLNAKLTSAVVALSPLMSQDNLVQSRPAIVNSKLEAG